MNTLEQELRIMMLEIEIEEAIKQTGVMMIGFPGPGGRPIVYTIGLSDRGWKELVFVGLRVANAQGIINTIVQSGIQPIQGVPITDAASMPIKVGPVCQEAVDEYLCQAVYRQERVNGPKVEALQLIMCDREGRFPGDPGFDADYMAPQLLLDTPEHAKIGDA